MKIKPGKRYNGKHDGQPSDDEMFSSEDESIHPISKKAKLNGQSKLSVTKGSFARKCTICEQEVTEGKIKLYTGHPRDSQEEIVTLIDPKLNYFSGEENFIHPEDQRPTHNITYYRIYCKEGHLVSLDNDLLAKDVVLYCSGYVKPIYDDSVLPIDGIPTHDIGPIVCWNIAGFDGGSVPYITIETGIAEYNLTINAHEDYQPIMKPLHEKMFLSKYVIEFLMEADNPTYEDLMNRLSVTIPPFNIGKFTEDSLLQHCQFLCDHVSSYDENRDPDEPLLIESPCMKALYELTGVAIKKRMKLKKVNSKSGKDKLLTLTKATTTELVRKLFENFFANQIRDSDDKSDKLPKSLRRRQCGQCESCLQEDCGICNACKDKKKFGGNGILKKICFKRRCPNIGLNNHFDDDYEDDNSENIAPQSQQVVKFQNRSKVSVQFSWIGNPVENVDNKLYYSAVMFGDVKIEKNDYVLVKTQDSKSLEVAMVLYLFEADKKPLLHGNWLRRGTDTILGETADPRELFLVDECNDIPLTAVSSKVSVKLLKVPENWSQLGNTSGFKNVDENYSFFYQLHYNPQNARFEDVMPSFYKNQVCDSCTRREHEEKSKIPQLSNPLSPSNSTNGISYYGTVIYHNVVYRLGDSVYLVPGSLKFKHQLSDWYQSEYQIKEESKYDEDMYPEKYRKRGMVKGSNIDTPEPFEIGYLSQIYVNSKNWLATPEVYITVNKLYRPHHTENGSARNLQQDLNLVYWSDEECSVSMNNVVGKCYMKYIENVIGSMDKIETWSNGGPDRFYFSAAYDAKNNAIVDPPQKAREIGHVRNHKNANHKLKNKGLGSSANPFQIVSKPPVFHKLSQRLRTLDVFSGCGGLSAGLHDAELVESKWAIEIDEDAANAYKCNFPEATVFHEDCNELLQLVINQEKTNAKGQTLPQRGEVDLMCGGPPCQGFSGMNRFNSREYSSFKNSLVVSYLSYCDYYRPRYFVMENVRNFVAFKKNMVLKLTLSCLIRLGYQCTIGIVQAGNFGIPQTRRRMIVLAAAPGERLPKYPEPLHAFSKRASNVAFVVDNKKYSSNCKWLESAPYRSITVRDAMCDLPTISSGSSIQEMLYKDEPITHFQRMVRMNSDGKLHDHICKDMSSLVEARMMHIPTTPGADWRDLPNIVVELNNNIKTNVLSYDYGNKLKKRGVCRCVVGKACSPSDRQDNTLIPWCLPHTADRHNNWAGLYGRVEWDGFFSTTVTNPEPMGKQGRVLHPCDHRVVSVRECARSQGFKDSFIFYGSIQNKHRQIGNAVPPPLAKALGQEIAKCAKLNEVFNMM